MCVCVCVQCNSSPLLCFRPRDMGCSVMTSCLFDHWQAKCKQSALNAEWKRCCWPSLCIDSRWQMAASTFSHKRPLNAAGYSWHCYKNRRGVLQINISQLHAHTHGHEQTVGTPGFESTLTSAASLTVYTDLHNTPTNSHSCQPFLLLVQFFLVGFHGSHRSLSIRDNFLGS